MLIDDQNHDYDLVTSRCLEGDLIEHERRAFRDGQARIVA